MWVCNVRGRFGCHTNSTLKVADTPDTHVPQLLLFYRLNGLLD